MRRSYYVYSTQWKQDYLQSLQEGSVRIERRIGDPRLNDESYIEFMRRPRAYVDVVGSWRGESGQFTLVLKGFTAEGNDLKVEHVSRYVEP